MQQETSFMRAKVSQDSGELEIEDVAAVIYATGFSSEPALNFIPKIILDTLDYDPSYPRLPLLLSRDCLTTSNTAPQNLAVMGSFDGFYWGMLESQARVIAKKWALDGQLPMSGDYQADEESIKLRSYMKELRSIMDTDPSKIPQNFFGDYIGVLEGTSRELGLRRIDLNWGPREGMVSPARYIDEGCDVSEAEKTMAKLQRVMDTSANPRVFSARAAFRGLQGNWKIKSHGSEISEASPTAAAFHPRNPTDSTFDHEYLVIFSAIPERKLVYRLKESENTIEVWMVSQGVTADKMLNSIGFNSATSDQQNCLSVSTEANEHTTIVYSFFFAGIHIEKFTIQNYLGDEITWMAEFFR
jgi:hypothetical protein